MFDTLTTRLSATFTSLRTRGKISKGDIESTCAEIREALLESDVALEVVEVFIAQISVKITAALETIQSG
ncbi:MAG: signal recognition particle receptor subunit alpha, partial [Candidatus Planktophila sp.]|nr:signal recognition particle receptor subunit alpha [Candidatus Planktophila sp.]